MSASGKIVEVLYPNGRRQKVKVTPSMTVLQILQNACEKQGFNANDYDLKHQNKVLNVNSMLRYLNLTNNAKLEMVPCLKPRAVKASKVTVALQLDDGRRLQNEFEPTATLMEILKQFENESDTDDILYKPQSVCVYMRNEYKGSSLSATTLNSMGIISGRAAIRLIFRECETDISIEVNKPTPSSSISPKIQEPHSKKQKLEADLKNQKTLSDNSQTNSLQSTQLENQTARQSNYNLPPVKQVVFAPPSRQMFPDDAVIKPNQIFPDNQDFGEPHSEVTFNDPPVVNEFANFKFPDNTSNQIDDDDAAIDPKLLQTEVKLSMPCDRKPIFYQLGTTEETPSSTASEEIDDSFFKVTIDDLRNRLQDLKSNRNENDSSLLMTKASRQRKEIEKIANFRTIPIRFQFPDKLILQAFFRPLETVSSIKEFLRHYIADELKSYEIFTTPPKILLKDNSLTLYKANLIPAALIYLTTKTACSAYVKKEFLEDIKTYKEAEELLENQLKRSNKKPSITGESSRSTIPRQHTKPRGTNSSGSVHPKGAPKWFKTGR